MNAKTTLAMLIVAVVVVLAALIGPSFVRTTDEAKVARGKVFPYFSTADAFRMEISRGDKHIICIKRRNNWEVVQPLEDKADLGRVEGVLSAFEFLRYSSKYENPDNLAKFGLREPDFQVTAADSHGEVTLQVGRVVDAIGMQEAPGAKLTYVKKNGEDTVYCVDGSILKDFGRSVDDFRSKEAFDLPSHKITRSRLKNPFGIVSFELENGHWMITQPVDYPADSQKISQILGRICGARKIDFVAENAKDLSPYALAEPSIAVRCTTADNQTKTLLIGEMVDDDDAEAKVYACLQGENDVFTISAQIVDLLAPALNDLRRKSILDIDPDQVVGFRREGEQELLLKDDGIFWQMSQPKRAAGDGKAVAELAKLIDTARIHDWIDTPRSLQPYGLDAPVIITFIQKDAALGTTEEKELHVGKIEGDKCFVRLPDSPTVLVVDAALAEQARAPYLAFLSKRMLEFSKWNAVSLEIIPATGVHFSAKRTGQNSWELTQPVAGRPDLSNLNKILWDLSSLDARRIVAEKGDPTEYGLDEPVVRVNVTLEEGKNGKVHSVLVGDKVGDAFYAKIENQDTIFTIDEAIFSHFKTNLLSPFVAQIDPTAVTSVAVKQGGRVFIAQRESVDAPWAVIKPEGAGRPNVAAINNILRQMQALRAVAFAAYRPEDFAKWGLEKPQNALALQADGKETVLFLGKKAGDTKAAYARMEGKAPVFILQQSALERLFPPLDELAADDSMNSETETDSE